MKKRLLKLGVLLIIGILGLAACSKNESDKVILVDSLEATAKMSSFESSYDLTMKTDTEVDQENPFEDMFSNINLIGTMKTDVKKSLFEMDLTTSLMGMAIEVHMIMDENIIAINAPFLSSLMGLGDVYILSDIEEGGQVPDVHIDEAIKEFHRILKETIEETIDDKNINIEDNVNLNTPEGDVSGQKINVSLTDEEVVLFIETLSKKLNDSDLLDTENDLDDDQLDVDKMEFNGTFNFSLFIDKNKVIRSADVDAELTNQKENNEKINIKLNFMLWNINNHVDILMPTFDESNSIHLEELQDMGIFFE